MASAPFDEWYRTQRSGLVAVLAGRSGDRDAAADAADEAFARAFERWATLGPEGHPTPWVYTVALNCLRRALRRKALEQILLRRSDNKSHTEWSEPDPDLWKAVRQLPNRQRTAVVLRYIGDLSEPEIADVMKVSRGTVSALLTTARKKLANSLERTDVSSMKVRHHA